MKRYVGELICGGKRPISQWKRLVTLCWWNFRNLYRAVKFRTMHFTKGAISSWCRGHYQEHIPKCPVSNFYWFRAQTVKNFKICPGPNFVPMCGIWSELCLIIWYTIFLQKCKLCNRIDLLIFEGPFFSFFFIFKDLFVISYHVLLHAIRRGNLRINNWKQNNRKFNTLLYNLERELSFEFHL